MVTVDIEGYISREAVMACVSPCLFERSLMFKGCRTFSASWRIGVYDARLAKADREVRRHRPFLDR
jgi:hypothetical protein